MRELTFSAASLLNWDPPLEPGADGVVYDAVRSNDPADFVSGASCVVTDTSNPTATDNAEPASGATFYYLLRAENGCSAGQGSLGQTSGGAERSAARSCP